jgi:hypothetical protein
MIVNDTINASFTFWKLSKFKPTIDQKKRVVFISLKGSHCFPKSEQIKAGIRR